VACAKEKTISASNSFPLMPVVQVSTEAALASAISAAGPKLVVVDFYADWCAGASRSAHVACSPVAL
jgi:thiol:disulfide interchange protein